MTTKKNPRKLLEDTETILADHAEAWHRETTGKRIPPRNSAAYKRMYQAWIKFAFADFNRK